MTDIKVTRMFVSQANMTESPWRVKAQHKYEEHRTFLPEWEKLYFFVGLNGKPICLLCQTLHSGFKASNLQRHFTSRHANMVQEFPKGTELHLVVMLKRQSH